MTSTTVSARDWQLWRKLLVLALCFASTAFAAYTAGAYASAIPQMMAQFHTSTLAVTLGITLFCIGFSFTPMLTSPISEVYGRKYVFVVSFVVFTAMQAVCALTPTLAGMLVGRFILGMAGSTFSSVVGGVLVDIFETSVRGFAMTIFTFGTFLGSALGPLVSDFIINKLSYTWVFYVQLVFNGIGLILVVNLLPETRENVLSKRAAALKGELYLDESMQSVSQLFRVSLTRPFYFLFTEPVIFWFSMWITMAWSILYFSFTSIPYIFSHRYNYDDQQTGLVWNALIVGSVISVPLHYPQDRLYYKKGGHVLPEARLYTVCLLGLLFPIGIFICLIPDYPPIVAIIAIGVYTIGIFSIYLAVFNYLSDCYGTYASSALAGQSFCRNIIGGFFPLFAPRMFDDLGISGAGGILGGVSLALCVVPFILLRYGTHIRARSKFAVHS